MWFIVKLQWIAQVVNNQDVFKLIIIYPAHYFRNTAPQNKHLVQLWSFENNIQKKNVLNLLNNVRDPCFVQNT